MIELEVKILDEKDLIFVSDLRNLGISRSVALTLVYLMNVKEASSREIEIGTGLRQPEISMAIGFMDENQWITGRMKRINKKGRPLKIYSFSVKMETVYEYYEQAAQQNYEDSVQRIGQLKKLINQQIDKKATK